MKMLTEKEIKESLKKINRKKNFASWFNIVKDILLTQEFQIRRLFKHHKSSVWTHSIKVSYYSYVLAKLINADCEKAAIGGLLHDFYPYAWQYSKELEEYDNKYLEKLNIKKSLFKKHGFIHAKEAAINYKKYFSYYEDKIVTDIILKHMFPLNIKLPRYKESWLVSFCDKLDSVRECPVILLCLLLRR